MSEEQPCRDPFYDIVPERVWLDLTNRVNGVEGTIRLVLSVNGVEKELYNGYVIDGLVMHGFNLTWLLQAKPAESTTRRKNPLQEKK